MLDKPAADLCSSKQTHYSHQKISDEVLLASALYQFFICPPIFTQWPSLPFVSVSLTGRSLLRSPNDRFGSEVTKID
jgi:hypothetical protein